MKYKNGEEFLNKLYKRMHLEKEVMHTATKNDTKEEKITKYLERLEKTHTIASSNDHKMDILKKFYYDKYIIKELPESYIDLQKKVIRKDTKTIIRMKEKDNLYGTLRISNMIPVPITELEPYIISDEKDLKYKQEAIANNKLDPMYQEGKKEAFNVLLQIGHKLEADLVVELLQPLIEAKDLSSIRILSKTASKDNKIAYIEAIRKVEEFTSMEETDLMVKEVSKYLNSKGKEKSLSLIKMIHSNKNN